MIRRANEFFITSDLMQKENEKRSTNCNSLRRIHLSSAEANATREIVEIQLSCIQINYVMYDECLVLV